MRALLIFVVAVATVVAFPLFAQQTTSSRGRPVGTSAIEFDFASRSPREFLDFMRNGELIAEGDRRVWIEHYYVGWISEEDIPFLLSQLDSKDPSLSLSRPTSAYLPGLVTTGDMSAYLIDSFRSRVFPSSTYSKTYTDAEKDEIRAWWSRYLSAIRVAKDA